MIEVITAIALLCATHTGYYPDTALKVQRDCQRKLMQCMDTQQRMANPQPPSRSLVNCVEMEK